MHSIAFPFRLTPFKGAKAYALALGVTALAAALSLVEEPLIYATSPVLFFMAISVSAWLGSARHGVFSALLSALFINFILLPPAGEISSEPASLLRTVVWLAVAGGVAVLVGKLRETQDSLFAILSSITDGFLSVDRNWKCTYVNDQGAALLRRPPEEVTGKCLWELFPPESGAAFQRECQKAIKKQQNVRFEEYHQPLDSWYEVAAFPSKSGLRLVLRDVSNRRRKEAEQAKMEQMLSGLPEGFAVIDRDWNLVYINENGAQLAARPRGEIIGRNCWALFPKIAGTAVEAEYRRCMEEKTAVHFEFPFPTLGRHFEIRAHPLADGICVVFQDVTERKEREGQLRSALHRLEIAHNAASIGTWDWNIRTNELIWSDNIAPIHGLTPQQFDGKFETWLRTIHPDDLQMVQTKIQTAIEERSDYYVEFRTIWADGLEHWVSGKGTVIIGEDGQPERMVGIGADIDRRRREEEALRRSEKLAAAGRLAATIAHEINNPLEAVTNLVYLMRRDQGSSEQVGELLKAAEEQLVRINHIARQTLAFYRERSVPEMIDAAQTFDELLAIFQARLTAKQVTVEKQFERVQQLQAFKGEIRQVLSNLLTNAIDASPTGGKLILRVKVGPAIEGTRLGTVLMEVEDFGAGIQPGDREHIFEPFFTTKSDVGTGLGLWVSRQIVEKHGGTLQFRTSPEKGINGTCFSVVLPLVTADAVANAS